MSLPAIWGWSDVRKRNNIPFRYLGLVRLLPLNKVSISTCLHILRHSMTELTPCKAACLDQSDRMASKQTRIPSYIDLAILGKQRLLLSRNNICKDLLHVSASAPLR